MTERGQGQDGEQLQPDRHMQLDRPFDTKTYQHNQLNQIVQSVQIPPVSESREVLDSSIYVTERGERQDGEQLQLVRHMQPDRPFDTKTYQPYQLNKMLQGVQSAQIQPVSERREILNSPIPVTGTNQYGQTTIPAGYGPMENSNIASTQLEQVGVATGEVMVGQLQREPVKVVTNMGVDVNVQPLTVDATEAVQTQ